MPRAFRALACAFAITAVFAGGARAEVNEITVAQQYGVSFLPLMMMEKNQLIEKHAAAAGLSGIKVSWAKVAGPSAMNDGLISSALHFAAQGAPSLITLWDKTRGQIKGVSAMTTYPLYLVTRNPAVKGIGDSTASQTAWALMGICACGDLERPSIQRGLRFLLSSQNTDGSWSEPEITGTGFPRVFYLKYDLYRQNFPLLALATYANYRAGRGHPQSFYRS